MPRLAIARPDDVSTVYRESHSIWGAGLSRRDYLGLWKEITGTRWATENAAFYVWLDDDGETILSSLKLYRPCLRLDGQVSRAAVLGAVFTPREQRGNGHARDLIEHVLEQCREQGARLSLLFSDIGTEYYSRMGYVALPATEQWGTLRRDRRPQPEGWKIRPATDEDQTSLRAAYRASGSHRVLAVERDEDHWEFLKVRSRSFFDRLGQAGVQQRVDVAVRDAEVVGYLTSVSGRGEWNVREVAAVDGDPRIQAQIVRLCAMGAFAEGHAALLRLAPARGAGTDAGLGGAQSVEGRCGPDVACADGGTRSGRTPSTRRDLPAVPGPVLTRRSTGSCVGPPSC